MSLCSLQAQHPASGMYQDAGSATTDPRRRPPPTSGPPPMGPAPGDLKRKLEPHQLQVSASSADAFGATAALLSPTVCPIGHALCLIVCFVSCMLGLMRKVLELWCSLRPFLQLAGLRCYGMQPVPGRCGLTSEQFQDISGWSHTWHVQSSSTQVQAFLPLPTVQGVLR